MTNNLLALKVLKYIKKYVVAGITPSNLDYLCYNFIIGALQAKPYCIGYKGYEHATCISVSPTICHGIPNDTPLKAGDILTIDTVVEKDGVLSDCCQTYTVGPPNKVQKRLIKTTYDIMTRAIKIARPNTCVCKIGTLIERLAKENGYYPVIEFCGHGIGEELHQEPQILNFKYDYHYTLKKGMRITIEPVLSLKPYKLGVLDDGWTVVDINEGMFAQFERTIKVE